VNAKFHLEAGVLEVTLSKRNLQTLLLKLDVPGSERTLVRTVDSGMNLRVTAEHDDVHYRDREPGPVHPREEEKLRKHHPACDPGWGPANYRCHPDCSVKGI
jgi:hypothetical protein